MNKPTPEELTKIIEDHKRWLYGSSGAQADLQAADLRGADLRGAYLRYADLQDANLRYADLRYANLRYADLKGARINWQSHDLIAELLSRAAGDDIEKRKIAGLILVSRDWCWDKFLKIGDPLQDWAIDTLQQYVVDGDGAPKALKEQS